MQQPDELLSLHHVYTANPTANHKNTHQLDVNGTAQSDTNK